MALDESDFKTLRLLMREEIDTAFERRFEPFRKEANERFEHLYAQNEKREQEYLFIREQLSRQEKQLTNVESRLERVEIDVKVIRDVVERHDDDLEGLKEKRA